MKNEIIRAGSWTILAYAFTQATRLLSSLILTRLLAPEVFGVMSIVMIVQMALLLFSDIGLVQCAMHSKRGDEREFQNTLWIIQIARGILISIACIVLGLLLAGMQASDYFLRDTVYAQPDLPYAIALIGFTAVLSGLESTKVLSARRSLQLGGLSKIEILSNIFAVVTTISWASLDHSIWALIGGWIAGALFKTVLTHLYLPGPTNNVSWDQRSFSEIISYGKWILVSSTLTLIVVNGDRLILSGLISTKELGIYSIAFLIVSAVRMGLSRLANHVVLPSLNKVTRETPEKFQEAYYRLRAPFDWMSLLAAGFFFSAGASVVDALYDVRYLAAGDMLKILGLVLISVRYEVAEQALLALGMPRSLATTNALRAALLVIAIPVGFFLSGLNGAMWGIIVSSLLPVLLILYYCHRQRFLCIKTELARLSFLPVGYLIGAIVNSVTLSYQ